MHVPEMEMSNTVSNLRYQTSGGYCCFTSQKFQITAEYTILVILTLILYETKSLKLFSARKSFVEKNLQNVEEKLKSTFQATF